VTLKLGNLTFDPGRRQLLRGQEGVHLSPKAWRLLEILVGERPKALSKSSLQERVWPDTFVHEANLPNLVSELREALGDDARRPRLLRTVHGFGYALVAEPSPAPDPPGRESDVTFQLVWGATEVDLVEGENVFGRDRRASIWLAEESISRRHALIRIREGSAVLEDLGSKNGTLHRGNRLTAPVPLEDGDEIVVGTVPMSFRVISTTASTVTRNSGQGGGKKQGDAGSDEDGKPRESL